jgi:hypothetical protein
MIPASLLPGAFKDSAVPGAKVVSASGDDGTAVVAFDAPFDWTTIKPTHGTGEF